MKNMVTIVLVYMLLATGVHCRAQHSYPQVFVGSSPCNQVVPGMDTQFACECIHWKLVLRANDFSLHCAYGVPRPGSTAFKEGGKVVDLAGSWRAATGTASAPEAVVYRFTDSKTKKTFSFLRLSDQVLHLLDKADRLMIGTAAWSYTLSRTGSQ